MVIPDREFASWVEPIARRDAEGRAELLEVARSLPGDAWPRPSPLEGWTCKDLLAHLAGDSGKWFSHILRPVLAGGALDPRRVGPRADFDAINRRDVDERRGRSVGELIAEIASDGDEHLELLSALTEHQKDIRLAPYSVSLAKFLSDNLAGNRGSHDREHLAQLRTVVEES